MSSSFSFNVGTRFPFGSTSSASAPVTSSSSVPSVSTVSTTASSNPPTSNSSLPVNGNGNGAPPPKPKSDASLVEIKIQELAVKALRNSLFVGCETLDRAPITWDTVLGYLQRCFVPVQMAGVSVYLNKFLNELRDRGYIERESGPRGTRITVLRTILSIPTANVHAFLHPSSPSEPSTVSSSKSSSNLQNDKVLSQLAKVANVKVHPSSTDLMADDEPPSLTPQTTCVPQTTPSSTASTLSTMSAPFSSKSVLSQSEKKPAVSSPVVPPPAAISKSSTQSSPSAAAPNKQRATTDQFQRELSSGVREWVIQHLQETPHDPFSTTHLLFDQKNVRVLKMATVSLGERRLRKMLFQILSDMADARDLIGPFGAANGHFCGLMDAVVVVNSTSEAPPAKKARMSSPLPTIEQDCLPATRAQNLEDIGRNLDILLEAAYRSDNRLRDNNSRETQTTPVLVHTLQFASIPRSIAMVYHLPLFISGATLRHHIVLEMNKNPWILDGVNHCGWRASDLVAMGDFLQVKMAPLVVEFRVPIKDSLDYTKMLADHRIAEFCTTHLARFPKVSASGICVSMNGALLSECMYRAIDAFLDVVIPEDDELGNVSCELMASQVTNFRFGLEQEAWFCDRVTFATEEAKTFSLGENRGIQFPSKAFYSERYVPAGEEVPQAKMPMKVSTPQNLPLATKRSAPSQAKSQALQAARVVSGYASAAAPLKRSPPTSSPAATVPLSRNVDSSVSQLVQQSHSHMQQFQSKLQQQYGASLMQPSPSASELTKPAETSLLSDVDAPAMTAERSFTSSHATIPSTSSLPKLSGDVSSVPVSAASQPEPTGGPSVEVTAPSTPSKQQSLADTSGDAQSVQSSKDGTVAKDSAPSSAENASPNKSPVIGASPKVDASLAPGLAPSSGAAPLIPTQSPYLVSPGAMQMPQMAYQHRPGAPSLGSTSLAALTQAGQQAAASYWSLPYSGDMHGFALQPQQSPFYWYDAAMFGGPHMHYPSYMSAAPPPHMSPPADASLPNRQPRLPPKK